MKKFLISSFILISFFSFAQANKEKGTAFIESLLLEKNTEKSYSFFSDIMKAKVTQNQLNDVRIQIESQLGNFKKIIEAKEDKNTIWFYSDFEKTPFDIILSFDNSEKIIGFLINVHKEFKQENRLGKELSIKSNSIDLKGTLLVPENNNLKKLVILIHGSGASDRDETIIENKPFKDIAEKLYTNGIASYRFDKRTFSNPETFNDKSTIDDEVTNDIVSIINYFKSSLEFSQYEITLLGHSLGANLTPRIANISGKVTKLVLLAGNARPLDELIVEQYEYLYKITPSDELKKEIEKLKKQVTFLHSKGFNLEALKENLPLGLSSYYWRSVLDYNPITITKKLKLPILILQGERDYQVTMTDYNLWKQSLKNNKNINFISYPSLNHLFMSGQGISKPEEYAIKGTVDHQAIQDITNFIIK